jgi:hypothetical protein
VKTSKYKENRSVEEQKKDSAKKGVPLPRPRQHTTSPDDMVTSSSKPRESQGDAGPLADLSSSL